MRCPFCHAQGMDRVVDSRETDSGRQVRRRRQCESCGKRFTTYERIEETVRLMVIKKDGSRVPYDRSKIQRGLEAACYKQPVSIATLTSLVDDVEEELYRISDREVSSKVIGELAARRLRSLNKVAYVRFASVYRQMQDLDELLDEVQDTMQRGREDAPGQQQLF